MRVVGEYSRRILLTWLTGLNSVFFMHKSVAEENKIFSKMPPISAITGVIESIKL